MKFLPWDAPGPPVRGVPGGQALRHGTRALRPRSSQALNAGFNAPCACHDARTDDSVYITYAYAPCLVRALASSSGARCLAQCPPRPTRFSHEPPPWCCVPQTRLQRGRSPAHRASRGDDRCPGPVALAVGHSRGCRTVRHGNSIGAGAAPTPSRPAAACATRGRRRRHARNHRRRPCLLPPRSARSPRT